MTYIKKTLAKDESILATGQISKWSLFHIYCAALIFGVSIICLPISALLLIYAWLKIRSTEMGVTSKRVVYKSGVIMRNTAEIRLGKVESVSVKQGMLGRIFGYGDVVIAGTGGNGVVMKGVRDPLAFRAAVDDACNEALVEKLVAARTRQDPFQESSDTIRDPSRPFLDVAKAHHQGGAA